MPAGQDATPPRPHTYIALLLQTGDPEIVASMYAPDGVLLPTVSNKVRTDHAGKVSEAGCTGREMAAWRPPRARHRCNARPGAAQLPTPPPAPTAYILLHTSPQVDYFKNFLQLRPFGTINESHVSAGRCWHTGSCARCRVVDSGLMHCSVLTPPRWPPCCVRRCAS